MRGTSGLVPEGFMGKQLQLLKEFVPQASRMAVLINPTMAAHRVELPKLPEFGRQLGVELITIEVSMPDQYEAAFEKPHAQGAEAIQVWDGPLLSAHAPEVVGLAARYRLPRCIWRGSTC